MIISLFKTVVNQDDINSPAHVEAISVLRGIKNGKWKDKVDLIRSRTNKADQDAMKKRLPAAIFGGKFSARRLDAFEEPSGLIALDFDYLNKENMDRVKKTLQSKPYILSYFRSPRGGGIKAIAKAPFESADDYKSIFCALDDDLGQLESFDLGTNDISRACFMSYDPDAYINENAVDFEGYVDDYQSYLKQRRLASPEKTFEYLLKWMSNSGRTYQKGERNEYLYVLSSAMCRYGIPAETTEGYFIQKFDLPVEEMQHVIESAYKRNQFGSVQMTTLLPEDDNFYTNLEVPDFDFDPERVIADRESINASVYDIARGVIKNESFGLTPMDKYLVLKRNEFYAWIAGAKTGKTLLKNFLMMMAAKWAGWKFIVLTTETGMDEFKALAVAFMTNKPIRKCSDEEIASALEFIDSHFQYVENDLDHLQLLDLYHYLKTKGYIFDAILIDPITNVDTSNKINAKGGNDYYNQLNAKYLKFAKKYCSLWMISHTTTDRERDKGVPYVQDAEFGVHIARRCHYGITLYRDMYDELNKNIVEAHIRYVRTALTKGGGTTTENNPLKFVFHSSDHAFGYDVVVDGITYKNPLHFKNQPMDPPMNEEEMYENEQKEEGKQQTLNPFGGPFYGNEKEAPF